MIKRILILGALSAMVVLAQGKQRQPDVDPSYKAPKTSWGEPDLQGIWPITHLISVGLQRKGGGSFMKTDEEYDRATGVAPAAAAPAAGGRGGAAGGRGGAAAGGRGGAGAGAAPAGGRGGAAGGGGGGQSAAIPVSERGTMVMRQNSLIFFPENGLFPELTPYGKELQAKVKGTYHPSQTVFDDMSDFANWDRCITRGMPVTMEPRNYSNGIRISQAPGYVVVTTEMAHESRIIPTGGLAPLDPDIKQWLGEPRGHWEGSTLVVESKNFNGLAQMTSAGAVGSPGPLQPETTNMRLVEKFTRVGPTQIDYEMTLEDPTILALGKMIIKYPMYLDNSYYIDEYACHEGNTAVRNYIETSRFERGVPVKPQPK